MTLVYTLGEDDSANWEPTAPTDSVVTLTHGGTVPPLLPILAVDVGAQTVTVGGDQTVVPTLSGSFITAATMAIAGSTGNDGIFYFPASAVYNAGSDRTVITMNTDLGNALSDPTADGTLQMPIVYLAEIPLAPNASVEWVFIETTVEWTGTFYGIIGDDDDAEGFCSFVGAGSPGGVNVAAVGRWQWPLNTLDAASSSPVVLIGSYAGIQFYPNGTTIRVLWTEQLGGSAGSTAIVVHHHFTEPTPITRFPA